MTYVASRDEASPDAVWILDLEELGLRYTDDRGFAPANPATAGLQVNNALSAELDITDGKLEFDDYEVTIADADGSLMQALALNDLQLRGMAAKLKYGFRDITEQEFHSIQLYLHDWGTSEDGGIELKLKSSLTFLARPVYADQKRDSVALAGNLAPNATTIFFNADTSEDGKDWPSSGTVLLTDDNTKNVELLTYENLTKRGATLSDATITARRLHLVGKGGTTWPAGTEAELAWVKYGDPVTVFLELATTTADGTNGAYDQGDGIGLGDKVDAKSIDFDSFEALRETLRKKDGTLRPALYVGIEEIEDLEEYFEAEFLALGWYLTLTREGKLGLRKVATIQSEALDITGKIDIVPDERGKWKRGLRQAENQIKAQYDYDPSSDKYLTAIEQADDRSIEAFGQADIREISSTGMRGYRGRTYGWPDLGWDRLLERRRWEYITELANPSEPISLEGSIALQDLEVGSLVKLTHPGIPDLEAGTMGIIDGLFYVTKIEHKPEDKRVELDVRQRRHMGRPFYIAPDPEASWTKIFRASFTTADGEDFADDDGVWDRGRYVYPTTGKGLDGTLTAGWSTGIRDSRDRDNPYSIDERHDSFMFANTQDSPTTNPFKVSGLPAGIYRVSLLSGDPGFFQVNSFTLNGWQFVKDVITSGYDPNPVWNTHVAYIDLQAGEDIVVGLGGGTTGFHPTKSVILNSIEIDRLDEDGSAGWGHVYKLSFTGDPSGGSADWDGEDAPGWTAVYSGHAAAYQLASIWPRQYLTPRCTGVAGWIPVDNLGLSHIDRRNWGSGLGEEYDSYHFVHDGFGANPPPNRTFRCQVRKGKYIVIAGVSAPDVTANSRANITVNGVQLFDDVGLTAPTEVRTRGIEVDVTDGYIDVVVGGGATAGLNVISTLQVLGRRIRSIRRVDFSVATPQSFEWGWEKVDGADAYDASLGMGWTVLPTGNGGVDRERKDATLRAKGKRWDGLNFTWNQTPGVFVIDKDEQGNDLENGTYWVRIGCADIGAHYTKITVNGVTFVDRTITAYEFAEFEQEVQVTDGRITVVLGDGSTADNGIISWLTVERTIYYEGGVVQQQYGHVGTDAGVFGDGRPVYDHGV